MAQLILNLWPILKLAYSIYNGQSCFETGQYMIMSEHIDHVANFKTS